MRPVEAVDLVHKEQRPGAAGCHGIPRRFEDFVARLTAPAPVGRYPSASAALDALASLYGREAVGGVAEVAVRPAFGESRIAAE